MDFKEAVEKVVAKLKADGCPEKIPAALAKLRKLFDSKRAGEDADLAYLEGESRDSYIHDMKIAQHWASLNRRLIAKRICGAMGWSDSDSFETIHNYLGDDNIIRKSAISAKAGEKVLIPLNMRDGSILAVGKGNDDWNCSAPHGAGRLMSRASARKSISMDDFKKSMDGVWSSSVCDATIDESPMAYKPSEKIVEQITASVDVVEVIKPLYNFKAVE